MTYDFSLTKRAAALFFAGWALIGVLLFFVGWVAGAHWAISDPSWTGVESGSQTRSAQLAAASDNDPATPKEPVIDDGAFRQDVLNTLPSANRQLPPGPAMLTLKPQGAKPASATNASAASAGAASEDTPAADAAPADAEPKILQQATPADAGSSTDAGKTPGKFLAFTVQVGAFLEAKESSQLIAELELKGYSPSIFVAHDAQDRQWYAVRIGAYAEEAEAARAAANFMKQEKIKAVVRLLGSL